LLTSPSNGIIADKLREMADILELQHEDGFRVAAFGSTFSPSGPFRVVCDATVAVKNGRSLSGHPRACS
jgi:hypothetical protein